MLAIWTSGSVLLFVLGANVAWRLRSPLPGRVGRWVYSAVNGPARPWLDGAAKALYYAGLPLLAVFLGVADYPRQWGLAGFDWFASIGQAALLGIGAAAVLCAATWYTWRARPRTVRTDLTPTAPPSGLGAAGSETLGSDATTSVPPESTLDWLQDAVPVEPARAGVKRPALQSLPDELATPAPAPEADESSPELLLAPSQPEPTPQSADAPSTDWTEDAPGQEPRRPDALLMLWESIGLQLHWGLYRLAPILATGDPLWGTAVGVAVALAEQSTDPKWRGDASDAATAPEAWLRLGTLITMNAAFVLARNLFLVVPVHWLVELLRRRVALGLAESRGARTGASRRP